MLWFSLALAVIAPCTSPWRDGAAAPSMNLLLVGPLGRHQEVGEGLLTAADRVLYLDLGSRRRQWLKEVGAAYRCKSYAFPTGRRAHSHRVRRWQRLTFGGWSLLHGSSKVAFSHTIVGVHNPTRVLLVDGHLPEEASRDQSFWMSKQAALSSRLPSILLTNSEESVEQWNDHGGRSLTVAVVTSTKFEGGLMLADGPYGALSVVVGAGEMANLSIDDEEVKVSLNDLVATAAPGGAWVVTRYAQKE